MTPTDIFIVIFKLIIILIALILVGNFILWIRDEISYRRWMNELDRNDFKIRRK